MLVFGITFLIIAIDQLTKWLAVAYVRPVSSIPVIPECFSLSYVENMGAAWGMFAGRQLFLILFTFLTLGWLIWQRKKLFDDLPGAGIMQGLLFGGIIGNLIDRIFHGPLFAGRVIDFLDFYWKHSHFPAFNVADSAIFCGVTLCLIMNVVRERRIRQTRTKPTNTSDTETR
ncbi:MAG: signal peptidase II [Kiritimatiellae bacterium]|nr:signal peptidase II [Kiritimatiellia bacterium]